MLSQMKWVRTGLAALMVVALLFGGLTWAKKPVPPPPPPELGITYELTLIYGPDSWVLGMNSAGHLVGWYQGVKATALYYSTETGSIDLNILLPPDSGWWLYQALDINDKGQIVGYGSFNGSARAYRCTLDMVDGVPVLAEITDLGLLHSDDRLTIGNGINEAGDVCGYGYDADGIIFSWYYTDDTGMQPLMGSESTAKSINDAGQIVGGPPISSTPAWRIIPGQDPEFFYNGGVYPNNHIWPNSMNNDGVFVGSADFEPVHRQKLWKSRAFIHDGTELMDLGAGKKSIAWGINDLGDVVGSHDLDAPNNIVYYRHAAFIYKADTASVYNLDGLVAGSSADLAVWFDNYSDIRPYCINDAGQISGVIYYIGGILGEASGVVGFILNPVEN